MNLTNNLIWFPSLATILILIPLTLIVEAGFVVAYCMTHQYSYNETVNLALIVILANLFTGAIGWMFKNFGVN